MSLHEFRHEALFYAGDEDYLAGTIPFIRAAQTASEPVLVAVSTAKKNLIKAELDGESEHVSFVDMAELGKNPARIIPAWREFVARHTAERQQVRGIGEPIWPGRSEAELTECQRHESLLNLAFEGKPAWWLLCPYDTRTLDEDVVESARRSHPFVAEHGANRHSDAYVPPTNGPGPFEGALLDPPPLAAEMAFTERELSRVRSFVSAQADVAGLPDQRAADLVLAVSELATNSVRYAGGRGKLLVWREDGSLLCDVRDSGRIHEPLAGRKVPHNGQSGGRGLWLVNQLCDLVQIRSRPDGNVVRLHMSLSDR